MLQNQEKSYNYISRNMIHLDDFLLFQDGNSHHQHDSLYKMQECKKEEFYYEGLKQIQPTRLRLPSFFEQVGLINDNNYYSTEMCNASQGLEGSSFLEQDSVAKHGVKGKKIQKQHGKLKNQTKNIPKNFGKGIICFIQKNENKLKVFIDEEGLSYYNLLDFLKNQKKYINTIADLRRLWTHQIYGKTLRIISNLFFRKYSLDYIFNSRISSYNSHIKNRGSLWHALKNPNDFNRIKLF